MSSRRSRSSALAGFIGLGAALLSAPAAAREIYPGALADAANMDCIPQCTLCHTTNPGTATTWSPKALPRALVGKAIDPPASTEGLANAWRRYAADPVNAAAVAAVKAGRDPEYGGSVCGPSYGCGARVAQRPARRNDYEVVLWTSGAVLAFASTRLLRRRRSAASARKPV